MSVCLVAGWISPQEDPRGQLQTLDTNHDGNVSQSEVQTAFEIVLVKTRCPRDRALADQVSA